MLGGSCDVIGDTGLAPRGVSPTGESVVGSGWWRCGVGGQLVGDGVAGGGCPGLDVDLPVDRAEVGIHGTRAQAQLACNVVGGQTSPTRLRTSISRSERLAGWSLTVEVRRESLSVRGIGEQIPRVGTLLEDALGLGEVFRCRLGVDPLAQDAVLDLDRADVGEGYARTPPHHPGSRRAWASSRRCRRQQQGLRPLGRSVRRRRRRCCHDRPGHSPRALRCSRLG